MSQTTLTKLYELIKSNQIDEAKKLITSFIFYCTDGTQLTGYLIYNDVIQSYTFSTKKNLPEFLPGDLHNDEYVYQHRLPKKDAFNITKYLNSTEFISNIHYITLDYSVKDKKFITIEKINGNNINKKMLNMKKSLPFCESVLDDINVDDYKSEIDVINNHIYEVLTSKQKGQYEYFLNFLSASAKGFKTRSSIYMQTPEGVGKGILMNFLGDMLGNRFLKSSSTETVTKFTIPFEGRTLVNIDELTGSADSSYKVIQDKLKTLITEPVFDCRTMHKAVYSQKNTFNIIITTNNNSIELSVNNSRRYVCMDVSSHRVGDFKYFENLKKNMDKKNVKIAYYKFLLERFEKNNVVAFKFDEKPFSDQEVFKLTAAMPPLLRFIKEKFLLNGKGVYIECQKLMKLYNEHVRRNTAMVVLNKELNEKLGLEKKRVRIDGVRKYVYDIDYKALLEIYKANKWLVKGEIDEDEDDNDDDETNHEYSEKDANTESLRLHLKEANELNEEYKKKIESLMKEKEIMQQKMNDMEDKLNAITITKDPIENSDNLKDVFEDDEEVITTKKKDKKKKVKKEEEKEEKEEQKHYSKMKVKELREYCKTINFDTNGLKKKEIIDMLDKIEEEKQNEINDNASIQDIDDEDYDSDEFDEEFLKTLDTTEKNGKILTSLNDFEV